MRTTKSVTISLPPAQLKAAERLAKKENRTISELFREALRRYESKDDRISPSMAEVLAILRADAKSKGLDKMSRREIDAEIATARKERAARIKCSSSR